MIPDDSNAKLWQDMKRRWLRHVLLGADALVGYVFAAAGTLSVEFILHHQKFMTGEGFMEYLSTALGTGVVGSSLYLRQKPKAHSAAPSDSSEPK